MTKTLYLGTSPQILAAIDECGAPRTGLLANIGNLDLSDCEIVVIGNGDGAKDEIETLATRGIDKSRLGYIDLQAGDDLASRIERPKHFFWDDVVPVADLDAEEDFPVYPSGIGFLDKNLGWGWRFPELGVLCGPYGCGKSTLGQILALNFVHCKETGRLFDTGAMLCSWEDLASEVYRNTKNFAQAHKAPDLMRKIHFVRRKPSAERTIAWYMDLVKYHKKRYGTRFFFLDPWNEMDHQKPAGQQETEYVKDIMRAFRDLVDEEGIIVIIATHIPGKFLKGDGSIEPFKIGNAFGSSQFGNKADRGICLVRTKNFEKSRGHSIIRLDKAKVERKMGRRGTVAARFDDERFTLDYDGLVTSEVRDIWKD